MNKPNLEAAQRRERLTQALSLLQKRYASLFCEDPQNKILFWISSRIEQEKDRAIKDALSHFEVSELIELKSIMENQQNFQPRKKRGP